MRWFSLLLLICSSLNAQDNDLERKLAGLIQTRAPSRQQFYNPFIESLANSKALASEVGLNPKQLRDVEKLLERRKNHRSKLRADRPRNTLEEPAAPELVGLSQLEKDRLIEEYDIALSKFYEARDAERDVYRHDKRRSEVEFALEFSESLQNALTDEQKVRFGQIILQSQMGQNRPLGIYFNQSLREWVKLTPAQFETMRLNAKTKQHELAKCIRDLVEKYHRRIRESLPESEKLLAQQTLMDAPELTSKGPTKVSEKFLELEYLNSQGVLSALSLFNNSRSMDSFQLIEFLDLVDDQVKEIKEVVSQFGKAKGDESHEERYERLTLGDRRLREDILLPFQVRMLAQQVIMATLNKPKPFGIYQQERFRNMFDLTQPEFIRVSDKGKDVVPEFLAELKQLLIEAHNEIRAEMPQAVKSQLDDVFGEPFLISMVSGK